MKKKFNIPKFYYDWARLVKKNKNIILKKKVIGRVIRNEKIRSILIDTKIKTKRNEVFERAVFIEKAGVVIVPILIYKNIIHTVLVRQFRICQGMETYEFPSGQAENKSLTLEAIKELNEETGIDIKKKDLKKLDSIQMITSSNSSIAHYYYFKKIVNKRFLNSLENKKTGNLSDNEIISLKVFKMKDLYKINIANIYAGLSMLRKKKIINF